MKVTIMKTPLPYADSLHLLTVTDDEGRLVLSKEFMDSLDNPCWCGGGVRFFEDLTNSQKIKKIEEVVIAIEEAEVFPNGAWVDGIEYQVCFIIHEIVEEIHGDKIDFRVANGNQMLFDPMPKKVFIHEQGDWIDLDEALIVLWSLDYLPEMEPTSC